MSIVTADVTKTMSRASRYFELISACDTPRGNEAKSYLTLCGQQICCARSTCVSMCNVSRVLNVAIRVHINFIYYGELYIYIESIIIRRSVSVNSSVSMRINRDCMSNLIVLLFIAKYISMYIAFVVLWKATS